MKRSCDQQISQSSAISGYLRALLLHLCPVCALKVMFPGLHTPLMDGMKYITAPRGALHQYNSPELTSSVAQQQCCISHTVTENWVQRGLMENKTLDLKEEMDMKHTVAWCYCLFVIIGLLFGIHKMSVLLRLSLKIDFSCCSIHYLMIPFLRLILLCYLGSSKCIKSF